jgi:hypothetical protein
MVVVETEGKGMVVKVTVVMETEGKGMVVKVTVVVEMEEGGGAGGGGEDQVMGVKAVGVQARGGLCNEVVKVSKGSDSSWTSCLVLEMALEKRC